MKKKIILGSANFNHIYGVKKNFIKKKEIKKLFDYATKNKVEIIDTSPLYNKAEKIIGSLNKNRFKIISKIPPIPCSIKKVNIKEWIDRNIMVSLKNLKIKKFEYLLLHNANALLGKNGDEIYKCIKNIKMAGKTNKIGISVYDSKVLEKIIKKFKFDLIQLPLNIFDQRMVNNGLLLKLKKNKNEIHARSVFLQGLLLLKHDQLPKKLKKFNKTWSAWEDWLKKKRLNSLQACLSFVHSQNLLDGIVVGCNSREQLEQILRVKKIKSDFFIPKFNSKNKKIIDPREWTN